MSVSEGERQEATDYLNSLLNKNLRVTTTDHRMFWGAFKCTDPVGLSLLTPFPFLWFLKHATSMSTPRAHRLRF